MGSWSNHPQIQGGDYVYVRPPRFDHVPARQVLLLGPQLAAPFHPLNKAAMMAVSLGMGL